ncbi:hypothetical protein N7516_003759 [Penicillium verrucosum]|uniref:uncharacterized protein n=1 Tax=Penicillium verrucosum TaxID=60171 RepID=UPI0025456D23|nr:uncharacterized protein N7516_003759 [Penicillium verrucosum]KAJ5943591.1 hypothetical protein N7516_003759 [Penicillium verrucosum]
MTRTPMQRSLSPSTTSPSSVGRSVSGGALSALSVVGEVKRLSTSSIGFTPGDHSIDDGVLGGLGLVNAETKSISTSSSRFSHVEVGQPADYLN